MANYLKNPNTGVITVEIYDGFYTPTNPSTGVAWVNELEAENFDAAAYQVDLNNQITNLPVFNLPAQFNRFLADMGEPTGFARRHLETTGVIEFSDNGTDIYGFNWDGSPFKRTDGTFATGTSYEVAAQARQFAIYPAPYPQADDFRDDEYFTVWVKGKVFDKSDIEIGTFTQGVGGSCYAYYDDDGTLITAHDFNAQLFVTTALIMVAYGNPVTEKKIIFGEERHGFILGEQHIKQHQTIGGMLASPNEFAITGLTTTSYTQFEEGRAYDEDISYYRPIQTNTPFWYIDGTPETGWNSVNDGLALGYIEDGNTRASYNENLGNGTFQLTEIPTTNDFIVMFFMLTNDSEFPIVKVIGQNLYTSKNEARDAVATERNNLILTGMPALEFVFLYAIIINGDGELQTLDDGSDALDLRGAKFL